jgi:hypothetical protein
MLKNVQIKLEFHEILIKKAEKENEDLKLVIDELKAEKKELKLKLNGARSDVNTERKEWKQQLVLFRENQNELKSQCNKMCVLEKKELQNNLEFKLQENAQLNEKLQRKEAEIFEKKGEIEKLKNKLNILLAAEN